MKGEEKGKGQGKGREKGPSPHKKNPGAATGYCSASGYRVAKCLFFKPFLRLISLLATAMPFSPVSTYVHATVHCVKLFCISFILLAVWCLQIQ